MIPTKRSSFLNGCLFHHGIYLSEISGKHLQAFAFLRDEGFFFFSPRICAFALVGSQLVLFPRGQMKFHETVEISAANKILSCPLRWPCASLPMPSPQGLLHKSLSIISGSSLRDHYACSQPFSRLSGCHLLMTLALCFTPAVGWIACVAGLSGSLPPVLCCEASLEWSACRFGGCR